MIYYEEYGDAENPTIIFLHGMNFPQTFYKSYCLAEKYHIVVPHIYGYGEEADETYNTTQVVDAICELARQYDRNCILVGFSLGAQLALFIESYFPELFRGGIFISALVDKNEKMIKSLIKPNLMMGKTLKWKRFMRLQGKAFGLKGEDLEKFVRYAASVTEETIVATIDNGIDINEFAERFMSIPYPTMSFCGIREAAAVKNSLYRITELNGRCDTDLWDRAAHNIPMLYSDRLNKTIETYMESIFNGN